MRLELNGRLATPAGALARKPLLGLFGLDVVRIHIDTVLGRALIAEHIASAPALYTIALHLNRLAEKVLRIFSEIFHVGGLGERGRRGEGKTCKQISGETASYAMHRVHLSSCFSDGPWGPLRPASYKGGRGRKARPWRKN
ncbi:hypothetical protein AUC71_03655 [Methyloceanibacter marginalis]|uniref:Uncharacterized protein n=1 Tax=Methyloceanibacter marginalis TaxID=1774971 RepID=A0A1E3W167_9HYPH|nr:hypothetical protein AUC71_03655 [Methyloceanibacter marginalis]